MNRALFSKVSPGAFAGEGKVLGHAEVVWSAWRAHGPAATSPLGGSLADALRVPQGPVLPP